MQQTLSELLCKTYYAVGADVRNTLVAAAPGRRRPVRDHAAAAAAAHSRRPGRRATAPGCRRPRAGRAALLRGWLAGAGGRCSCQASAGSSQRASLQCGGALCSLAGSPALHCVKHGYCAGFHTTCARSMHDHQRLFKKGPARMLHYGNEADSACLRAQPLRGAASAGDHRGGPAGMHPCLEQRWGGQVGWCNDSSALPCRQLWLVPLAAAAAAGTPTWQTSTCVLL